MTATDQLDSWRAVFESRDIDVEETTGPDADASGWFQTLTRFSKRGFLRAVVSADDEDLVFHVQLAVPGAGADYAQRLKQYFEVVSGSQWQLAADERPWTFEARVSLEENLEPTVDALELVASHLERAEAGEDADALADVFDRAHGEEDDEKLADETSAKEASGDEPSGAEEPAEEDAEEPRADDTSDGDTSDGEPVGGGVFETIGTEEHDHTADPAADRKAGGEAEEADDGGVDLALESFNLKVSDEGIMAKLELSGAAGTRAMRSLRRTLERSLRARFDVKLMLYKAIDKDEGLTIKLGVVPAAHAAQRESVGEMSREIGRFFERIKKFNDLGMSLLEVLDSSRTPAPRATDGRDEPTGQPESSRVERSRSKNRAGRERQERRRPDESSEPHLHRREDHRRAESETSGVVFSFAGAELQADGAETLEAGNFTDRRLRREDATTPLVDVVLRHPGYSDKSMRQVLSILLDIDYYEARKLAADAPCVIAWGTSQERAREFKRVIENAGGKVTLVEPDSFREA